MLTNRKLTAYLSCCPIAPVLLMLTIRDAEAVEFNTDVLDASDRQNINVSRFSQAGYVMPGQYQLQVVINGQSMSSSTLPVTFAELKKTVEEGDKKSLPQACLTREIVAQMGLTETSQGKLLWIPFGETECADFSQLPGVEIQADLSDGTLLINMPQAWLEYSDATWLPPSRWDNGIPGLMLDYNLNATVTQPQEREESRNFSFNGTTGANFGPWRLRADYQGNITQVDGESDDNQFDWNRVYLYRAIPKLQANLTLGENYISSDIFSAWNYTGVSLESDDRMLPPKLRGYAPQVSGVAETNARVVISQQGRILYDATVPAGPFTIQDLDSSIRGRLDVEVIEQNGQKKTFQVDTAYVPYLTRPGQVRYKLISGKSRTNGHDLEGPFFVSGEASWGINNSWSLYGGGIISGNDYNALAIGLGRDMNALGTLSTDLTQSIANFDDEHGTMKGKSWRMSYSKRFDEANADINFAGYRFSENDYMSMQQYLDARYRDDFTGREKQLYTATLNKSLGENGRTSVGLQLSHQTYWDDTKQSNYYTLSINHYMDIGDFRGISMSLSASRSRYYDEDNDSLYFRISIPTGGGGTASYNLNTTEGRVSQTAGYSNSLNKGLDNYSINAGVNTGGGESTDGQFNGYYSHTGTRANLSTNLAWVSNDYTSLGLNLSGGATLTAKGAALHAGGTNGGTRLLVDTEGVAGVPVNGGRVTTNRWGTGVVTGMSSYYRNTTSIDLNKLPEDMEATRSVVESVLTEGAIGYREFGVLKGAKLFAVVKRKDGTVPPFGASVTNTKGTEVGMVSDEGLVWLSGVALGETLQVGWDGQQQCSIALPETVPPEQQLLLPCQNEKA
ncbi:PapC family outer membrane usher protein [Buttiauxella ferragutiae ATCC 51602]|jgi:outer membrane usher protein PapC|uniref:PapC family outer membrane usher protein n=2 Tax=Enterobacteriaceae TaxID=543 RepID=A0ABX2W686_9ENTR|nr:PapC family outer membrane usher protein [Buttiauxella ferragutiae ATCC 51602]TDN54411.1 outer membrane usher protein PapC [Buttiauxella sp. JUb87]